MAKKETHRTMHIEEIKITTFRNMSSVHLLLSPQINIFLGKNGSGKTSLLEAVYYLSTAKSFRNQDKKNIIKAGFNSFALFAKLKSKTKPTTLGIGQGIGHKTTIKIDSEKKKHSTQLARVLPMQLLCIQSTLFLTCGPGKRRKYLDWGAFYLYPEYMKSWKKMKRSLDQRNSLLKQKKKDKNLFSLWSSYFIQGSEEVDTFRKRFLTELKPELDTILKSFESLKEVEISYYKGWSNSEKLEHVLIKQTKKEEALKQTLSGPQRADIHILCQQKPAAAILSRGQTKAFVFCLKVAQSRLIKKKLGINSVFLIDDFMSELDSQTIEQILLILKTSKMQVLIADITKGDYHKSFLKKKQTKLFHVKHGSVSEMKNENKPESGIIV